MYKATSESAMPDWEYVKSNNITMFILPRFKASLNNKRIDK